MFATMAAAAATVLAGGGTTPWELQAHYQRISGMRALCLKIDAEGSFASIDSCAAGDVFALRHNVVTLSSRELRGETVTINLVGGVTLARARTVHYRFEDGTR